MLAKLRAALDAALHSLGVQQPLRARATRRMKSRHAEQEKAERQALAARERADELRAEGHTAKAERKDRKALRLDAKAATARAKAIVWRQRARVYSQRIHKLNVRREDLEAQVRHYEETHGPHVGKNGYVAGADTPREAAIFAAKYIAAKCASNGRPNYYSMTGGGFNVTHALRRGSQRAIGQVPYERSDCSVFVTEVCWAANLPDPNGANYTGGYTGTLVGEHNGWKEVSERVMRAKGWGYVVYGPGAGHHTEFYVGEGGSETIGHGSAPVDPGVIDLFGDGSQRCFIYVGD